MKFARVAARRKAPRNFGTYAKMEAANVVLVPGLALWAGWPRHPAEAAATMLAVAACAGLLVIGTLYWTGVDRRLRTGKAALDRALAVADRLERPLLVLTAIAALAIAVAALLHGFSVSVIAAIVLTVLAVLEYVNYYHRQLQHFDNWADVRRLLTGKAGRPSHMARDLIAYRGRVG